MNVLTSGMTFNSLPVTEGGGMVAALRPTVMLPGEPFTRHGAVVVGSIPLHVVLNTLRCAV